MRLATAAALVLATALAGCGSDQENVADRAASAAAPPAEAAALAPKPRPSPAPAELQAAIEALARPFEGDVGVAVKDLQQGWAATWQGDKVFPQQSTMKVWLAVAVLDAVDRGELRLDEVVVVTPPDLSVFNSPMVRPLTLKTGRLETTVDQLLLWAISKSDNAATDILMRRVGGGEAVQPVLERKGLRDVQVGVEERLLQPRISGLEWRPEYIDGDLFNRARDRVPDAVRDSALDQYLRAPPDGATPVGTVNALESLVEGELLSPASTQRLLRIMSEGRAGGARLKAGLPPAEVQGQGWRLSHKTGTGPDWRKITAGYNDVGVMLAPDGRAYAVAVYIGRTERPVRERQTLIADVARAVVAQWEGTRPPPTQAVAVQAAPAQTAPPQGAPANGAPAS
jgi:beta-lactamase class A